MPYPLSVLFSVRDHKVCPTEISLITMELGGEDRKCSLNLEGFIPEFLHVIYTHISLTIRMKCSSTL